MSELDEGDKSDVHGDLNELTKVAAIEIHRATVDICEAEEATKEAQEDWNKLDNVFSSSQVNLVLETEDVNVVGLVNYFHTNSKLDVYEKCIVSDIKRTGFRKLFRKVFGPPKLHSSLIIGRNFIFKLALCSFDNESAICKNSLRTIYRKITESKLDCPRYGNHWEQIGFQGCDPVTDLRGCGMLALMQILNLCQDRNLLLCKTIYKLSGHHSQHFPFSVVSVNITSIVLQALREQTFNKDLNKRRLKCTDCTQQFTIVNTVNIINEYHVALVYHFYRIWKSQGKTINDSGYVFEEIKKYVKNNPVQLLNNLREYFNQRRSSCLSSTS